MEIAQPGDAAGDDLEQALRAYESALAANPPGRHAHPDDDNDLQRLRWDVVRLAESLPSACWPRPVCAHCQGEREVQAVRVSYQGDAAATLGVSTLRRSCPVCWGTGLSLHQAESG